MRNKTVLLAILGIFAINISIIQAQEVDTTYWLKGGVTTLTFSQVNLTNWASGGNNNISMNGYFNVFANYTKAKVSWTNNLEMGYGIVKQGVDAAPQKTDDIIIATTQIGYKLRGEKLYWSSLLDFRTQFYQGIDADGNVISDFMSPGYLLVATGLDWRPSPILSVTYAPVTGKFTFVSDQELADEGAFGVDPGLRDPITGAVTSKGSTSRAELGSFLKVKLQLDNVVKNVSIGSKLELFSNYLDNFGNVDVNWQNIVAMKVNSFLTVNWQTQLIYDDDIKIASGTNLAGESIGLRPRTQFKSVFGVGLSFKFGDQK